MEGNEEIAEILTRKSHAILHLARGVGACSSSSSSSAIVGVQAAKLKAAFRNVLPVFAVECHAKWRRVCLHGIQRRNILLGVLAVVVISHVLVFQSPLGTWALSLITLQLIFAEAKRIAIELARLILINTNAKR